MNAGKSKKNFLKKLEQKPGRGVAGEETGLEDWDAPVDEAERRRRQREAEMEADLDNAAALFDGVNLEPAAPKPAASASPDLVKMKTTNKAEWEAYANAVYESVVRPKAGTAGFDKFFFPQFLALLTTNGLRDVDMRKGSTKLRELAEAKDKADQELKRSGGNAKPAAGKAKPKQVGTSSAKNTYVALLTQHRHGSVWRRSAGRRRFHVVRKRWVNGIQCHAQLWRRDEHSAERTKHAQATLVARDKHALHVFNPLQLVGLKREA